jgi:ActR/RegA family two-component response regulator
MELNCFLLTRDDEVVRPLRRVMDDLGVTVEVCTGADKAAEALENRKYDAVLIDCDDMHDAMTVLRSVRLTPSNKSSTVFAIVNGITTPTTAIELGANLALEKPINESRARHAFRAIHGLMLQERRRYYRHAVDMAVTLRFEDKENEKHHELQATAVNISEGGLAIKSKSSIPWEYRTATLKFVMPGTKDWIEMLGSIAWADEQGNAGIRFESVPQGLRERFDKYFREIEKEEKQAPRAGKDRP